LHAGPQTLTGDWFGQGPALRDAGFDFRLEWSQFYQGLVRGEPGNNQRWAYGGKWDAQVRVDLSKIGFWDGLSVTAQGVANYGQSVNGIGGSLLLVNTALFDPGIDGADASDLMALYVTQKFSDLVSVRVGKLNFVEFARATPLRGGGGVDTFWNIAIATPLSGILPPVANGAMLSINTQPVSYALTIFDPVDATNRPPLSDLFENGVAVMGSATLKTTVAGLTGYYGIVGRYSTKEGRDFNSLLPPPGTPPGTKNSSYFVSLSMQQYLVQDPSNPARGWGIFGEIAKTDGNPNPEEWMTYVGIGGTDLIPGRPEDRFGVAYLHFSYSNVLKKEVAPVFNLANVSGVEVFYNVAVTPWFRITGDLQFLKPANGDRPNSTYVGFSSYVKF
jgi:porin